MPGTYRSQAVGEPAVRDRLAVGAVRATVLVLIGVLAVAALDRTGAIALALDGPRSIPTVLAGTLLVAAGALAWGLGGEERSSARATWRVGAIVFALLGIERITSLHDWVRVWEDASFAVVFGPVVAAVVVVWGLLARRLADRPASFAPFITGAALWLASQLPEAFGRAPLEPAGAAGELVGSGLLAAALLLAVPAERVSWGAGERGREWLVRAAERVVRDADARTVAVATAAAIVIFAALGGLLFATDMRHDPATEGAVDLADHPLQWFDPNRELTFNTYFSALIPTVAAALALLLTHLRAGGTSRVWLGLAVVLAAVGGEELLDVHGKFQDLTGVEAQLAFAPVGLAAAVVGILAVRGMRAHRRARGVFAGGAVAWAVALVIDVLIGRNSPVGILEDGLEMVGSAMFAVALLMVAKAELDANGSELRSHRPTGE